MAVRAVATCSLFRPPSPPLLPSALRLFSSPFRCSCSLRHGAKTYHRSFHSVFDSVMEELRAARRSRHKRVSAAGSSTGFLNEELVEDRLVNRSLQKGLLLEFKKDSDRVLLAVAQRPDGKKNWMVSDQNGVTSSIKLQQVTYIVPGIDNFDQADITDFALKAQDNMDLSLLEYAWIELLEKNKSVTVEELAEIIFGSTEPLDSYSAHLLLSKDEVYFTVLETKGSRSIYGPRPSRQVEELIRRKLAKEAAEKEFLEFIELLASVKSMSLQDKPPKSSWTNDEKNWRRIESLVAYAIDSCKSDEQRKTAGMILKELGLAKTSSSAVKLLIDIGYFPVHINLDLLRSGIPTDHSEEIISAAQCLLLDISDPDKIDRKNLTDLKVYAIDVDEADELDDALSATKLQDGRIQVWIHVADPTRYVQPGSIVDREAMRRGTSVFLPTATYSMFPENLAMGGMSLRQGELCNAVTVSVVLHNDGSIAEYSVFNSVIKPTYMLTYESASELLHLNLQEEGELRILSEAANLRSNWRRQQGAIETSTLDTRIKVFNPEDPEPSLKLYVENQADPAMRLVFEMMILCGEAIAMFGSQNDIPLPYRGQPQSDINVSEFSHLPEGPVRSFALVKVMRAAEIDFRKPARHGVLGIPGYVQFTSPIRRYLDLLAHYQDRSSKHMIGTGCESHGLYLLRPSPHAGIIMESPSLLHAQFGHPSLAKLQQLVPSLSKLSSLSCESCELGKHTRSSFPRSVSQRASSPFSLVHSDIWGPSRVKSTLGFQYFVTFIDDYSRCTWLFLMKNRSELFSIFQSFFNEIKTQFGVSIRTLRSDNGREYLSSPFKQFMAAHGILHQTSCAYTPQQNGVAERKNRHLIETTRTLLIHGQVPSRFWGDAVLTACYLINRMPSSVLDNKIPHSVLFPQDPLHPLPLRVFGSTCFVHDFSPGLDKLSPRSHKCVFLGFPRSQKGYKCFSPSLNRHFISADVTFDESSFYFSHLSSSSVPPPPTVDIPIVCDPLDSHSPQDRPSTPPLQVYSRRNRLPHDSPPVPPPVSPPAPANESDLPIALRKGIRSTRNPSPHYTALSYHRLSPSFYTCLSSISSVSIPKSVGDALTHPGWRQAMLDELSALQKSGTWELVQLPSGKSVVGCRWVYAIKVGPDGTIDRLKARLVAKGYTQIFGLDYGDTFSPVAKMTSVRLFIAMAALRQWPLYQLDVKNAFLNGDLQEEIYMEQPPGFVAQGESSGLVCRLRKSLYGLKQSPRAWFGKFSSVVQQFGMSRSEADHSVFYRHSSAGCIYLIVYVDDIILTGSDYLGISQMKQHLCHHFQTKDLGKLRYFLGIEVAQSNDGIVISQRKYALDILEETGLMNCKSVETPMDPNIKLLPNQGEPFSDPERYRRLVGKLNYLTVTRPDISFAVSVVSQFLNSPCEDHWDAVVRILKYIKGSPGKGLLYGPNNDTKIVCYSDADWAGSPSDRRSTSGYCVSIGGNLISWKSKKQSVVARSSAEAEYRAMASATCELVWLKQLLSELKFGDITHMTLICDNQAALHISSNPVFHERTKHIEVDCHFIREKIISGDIKTEFVNSSNQLADIFTKSLRGPRIDYLCNKLGTYDLYAPA